MLRFTARHWPQYCLGILLTFAWRLLPWRPPNVTPLLSVSLPYVERFGAVPGALFSALSIVLLDAAMGLLGTWTFLTAGAYALVTSLSRLWLQQNGGRVGGYLFSAVVCTLLYDALTGLTVGPLVYGQPFAEALVGQIPFTINHLFGNLLFCAILSPLWSRWIVSNRQLEAPVLWGSTKSKDLV